MKILCGERTMYKCYYSKTTINTRVDGVTVYIKYILMGTSVRQEELNRMESSKVYVNVMAEFTKDGRLLPRSFIWKDGQIYEIQRVTDVRRAASLKAGGVGIRYTCIVNGRESHLFYEDNNMWFMEER